MGIVNPDSELNGQSHGSLLYPAGTENEDNRMTKCTRRSPC